jgi:hypothetical protein
MYADDGLYFQSRGEENTFFKWMDRLYWKGIKVESEKTRWVDNKFKFLGVEFDQEKRMLEYNNSRMSFDAEKSELISWLKSVSQWYGKEKEGWSWNVRSTSMLTTLKPSLSLTMKLKILAYSIWNGKSWKGYRYFLGSGIYDVIGSSAKATNKLMYNVKMNSGKLSAIRSMDLRPMGAFNAQVVDKGKYSVKIEHIWPNNYQPWKFPHLYKPVLK